MRDEGQEGRAQSAIDDIVCMVRRKEKADRRYRLKFLFCEALGRWKIAYAS